MLLYKKLLLMTFGTTYVYVSSFHHATTFTMCMLNYQDIHVQVSLRDWRFYLFNVNTHFH